MVNSDHHATAWKHAVKLYRICGVLLPAHERRTPGKSAAHRFQKHEIALLDAPIPHRDRQRQRYRCRRSVAVKVDGQHHLLRGNMKFVRGSVDEIRLLA